MNVSTIKLPDGIATTGTHVMVVDNSGMHVVEATFSSLDTRKHIAEVRIRGHLTPIRQSQIVRLAIVD